MNKTITINPDLFKVGGRGSRKRSQSANPSNNIKVRAPKQKNANKTLRKNHVLRFLRENQQKNMNELIKSHGVTSATPVEEFKSDFDKSLEYLTSLTTETKNKQNNNSTLKKYPTQINDSVLLHPSMHITEAPLNLSTVHNYSSAGGGVNMNHSPPVYGCLKGGNLPTYKMYKNVTQKNYSNGGSSNVMGSNAMVPNTTQSQQHPQGTWEKYNSGQSIIPVMTGGMKTVPTERWGGGNGEPGGPPTQSLENIQSGGLSSANTLTVADIKKEELKQKLSHAENRKKKMRHPKQKRTVRRTFKTGKSKNKPTVSVLISNKTIRNQISTKSQLLKQTPIPEVRRYLTKKGFIRVGSDAPNDVLRKMYESAVLICGELQNHNPDNLLYNFMNDIHP